MPLTFERGLSTRTQPPEEDGKIIYHTDTSRMYFDTNSTRQEINANDARSVDGGKKLTSTAPSASSTNSTFPTSLAVHNYSSSTYMTQIDPSGSGTFSFDGNEELTGNLTIEGNLILNNSASTQAGEPYIRWDTRGSNENQPYIGFASDQSDGTFVWSLQGTTYTTGLAIGGGSGNLLWKGVKVPTINDIPTSFTVSTTANDDDVVVLSGSGGANSVTYTASHAQKGPADGYISGNTTTSISGYGDSKTIKIPQITVDAYGHVTAGADEEITITMPSAQTLPTSFTISATANDDDIVTLSSSGGANSVTYTANHAKKGPSTAFAHSNTTTNFYIPNINVDTYGHTTAAANGQQFIVADTLPTTVTNGAICIVY